MARARRTPGFTLIELMVVISILALLLTLLVPAVGKAMESIRRAKTEDAMAQIRMGLSNYKSDFRNYPPSGEAAMPTGAGNLVYYLRGPAGGGWGIPAGGVDPYGNKTRKRILPYYRAEESDIAYDDDGKIAGYLDFFEPRGDTPIGIRGLILYYKAGGDGYAADDNELDSEGKLGFADDGHFQDSVSPGDGGYVLISPGPDRHYGLVKTNKKGDLVPADKDDDDTSNDDIILRSD